MRDHMQIIHEGVMFSECGQLNMRVVILRSLKMNVTDVILHINEEVV